MEKCLGGLLLGRRFLEHSHDVGLFHDQDLLTVDLDLGARPLAEQHAIADLEIDRDELAGTVAAPTGPTATISPCEGFSWAVSGMMMPPADFASGSIRSTTTQSCSGRNFIGILLRFPQKVWQIWTLVVLSKAVRRGPLLRNAWRSGGIIYRLGHACLDCAGSFSRHLPNERAELLILPRHDPKLLAHLCSRQLDKFRRGFHTEQLVDVERFHK